MKKLLLLIVLFCSFSLFSQKVQMNAPWANEAMSKNNSNPSMDEVSEAAEAFFKTINKEKKGSGLKPFERWRYHWSFFLDENGRIQPKEDLWKSWEEKNQLNNSQRMVDVSNWTSLGPYSHENTASWSAGQGRVNTIAVDPSNSNTIYVGAPAGGIWKSTDAGVNWIPLTDYLPQIGVSGIAIDHTNSDIIYIATGDDDANDSSAVGVWKSTDGGTTWNNTGPLTGNPGSMNEIYISPNDASTILVATSSGIHKSTDGGATWVRKLATNARGLKMKPNDPTTWYAINSGAFFKSTDSGESFQLISISGLSGAGRIEVDVTPANPDVVYIVKANAGSFSFGGIFKSSNSGTSFTKTGETSDIFGGSSQAWYDLALTVSDTDENIVYVGVLDIWKSTDGGEDFSQLNQWNAPNAASYTHADIHFMRYIGGRFFAGTDGGIYLSDNDGSNFTDLTENLAISQFYRISVAVQNYGNIAGGLQDNGGYALSDNQWKNYFGADGMDCAVNPTDPNNYFGFTQNGGGLYETKDGGRTRTGGVGSPQTGNWVTPLVSNSEGEIYAGYSQLYRLQNNTFWTVVSSHNFNGRLDLIRIDPNDSNNIYVTRDGFLYRSSNKGVTFETISPGFGNINALEVSSTDSNVLWIVTNIGVYKIPDIFASTVTYETVGTNTPSESKLSLKYHERSGNNTLYLGTALGVYMISDDSTEWETFDNNLPNVAVRDLEINEEDAKLIAATYGRGIFISDIPRQLPPTDVRVLSVQNPSGFNCDIDLTPQITIKNQGTNVLTSATVNYNFDGGTNQVYNWSGSLNSEENITIDLPQSSVTVGAHTINIEVTATNDTFDINNTISSSFLANKHSSNPTIVNSFENSDDELTSENSNSSPSIWEITNPSKTLLNTAGTGSQAYMTRASGNYPNNVTSYLYTNCYDLTQISSPVLSFKMAFDIEEDWDYLQVEYSTDTGDTWQTLGSASDPNWYNSSSTANNIPGAQWTGEGEDSNSLGGTNATVHDYSHDLSSFNSQSNIVFRFKFVSDTGVNEEGVMIDDLVVTGVLSVNNEEFSSLVSVYPNPSSDVFNIKWSNNESTTINAYNYLGQTIFEKKNVTTGSYSLDLSNRSPGLYIVKINSNGKIATKKIILE